MQVAWANPSGSNQGKGESAMPGRLIPDGFHTVTPYLFVAGVARLLDFAKAAFDVKEEICLHGEEGSVMHAVVRIGDSAIMMGDPTGPAAQFGPMPSSICLYGYDCDSVYQRALEAGGKSVMEVTDITFNGERCRGVIAVGNIWWIGTHVKDVPWKSARRE